jgi:outer membrane receptor for ferrienterochelin and colicins
MSAGCHCLLRLALFAAGALPLTASAEDPLLLMLSGDEQLVSLATGSPRPVSKAPAVATVITAEDIKATGSTDLSEVLESVPGLHVSRSGSQWLPLYSIRGIFTRYNPEVLVMVNGIPLTNAFAGDRGRLNGTFPLEHVARIEVIRGPGSALYGAEAVSGVINIITKTAADIDGTETGLRAGSFRTYDGWVQHGGKWGDVDVAAYLRLGHTDGFGGTIAADAQTRRDTLDHTHASNAPGPLNTGYDAIDARIDLSLDQWRLRAGYTGRPNEQTGTGVADALDPKARDYGRYTNLDLTWRDAKFTDNWDVTTQASYYDIAEPTTQVNLYPAGSSLPHALSGGVASTIGMIGQPQHWERQHHLNLSARYGRFERHKLQFGAGYNLHDVYRVEAVKNYTYGAGNTPVCLNLSCSVVTATQANGLLFLAPHARRSLYAYAQDEWFLAPDWYLTAGLRHDHYSDFGGTTNPRVALVWDTAYNLTSKLMFGRAFRAPSFTEQHNINNPTALGNPNLKPETISTTELAFSWQAKPNLKTGLNLFHYRMKDVIRFVANTGAAGNTAQNAGNQNGKGLELEFTWDAMDSLRLAGNYAYQRSIDENTNKDAGLAPHHHAYLRTDWRFIPGWTLSGQVNWVADRMRQATDNRPRIADYTTTDLTLRTGQFRKDWELAVSVRNLLNVDAREPTADSSAVSIPNDLPLPGRSLYLELRIRH